MISSNLKVELMKKLLALMIVLFPVTAWAGAHDIKKPRKVLCADLYQNAPDKLRTIEFLNFMKNKAEKQKAFSLSVKYKNELQDLRQQLAQEATIYRAFCK